MKNKKENLLEKIPVRQIDDWTQDDQGIVTLNIHNKGVFNKIAQTLFKKPKISYVHLDEMGSFIWPILDGETNIIDLGKAVKEHFGEKANPLYERLSQYFKTLEKYNFIEYK